MMTLKQMYDLAVAAGIKADPRGEKGIKKLLAHKKEAFEAMPAKAKKYFDKEDLANPFADSRVLVGDPNLKVSKAMAGIDITSGEVAVAGLLNQQGAGIDLLIAHHPVGAPYAALHEVMDMQADNMARYGVPINIAEGVMRDRIEQVSRSVSPRNHNQAVDAARLLGLGLMCTHTITDNLVFDFLEKIFDKKKPETVQEVLDILHGIPEYQEARKGKNGPVLFAGNPKNRAGRVAPLEITGGTEGSHIVYEKLAHAGVGTIISMHASEEHRTEALKHHINLVIAGHMSSDSLGMNLLLDKFEKKGVKIVPCSGLIRIRR